jgi:cell division septation protein DedD
VSAERRPSKGQGKIRWISTLTIGTIVVAAGLAVGIVVGVTWEEPGLVFGWVSGDTDGIQWGVEDPSIAGSIPTPDEALATRENGATELERIQVPGVAAPPPPSETKPVARPTRDRDTPPPSTAVVRPKSKPAPSRSPVRQDPAQTADETGPFSVQVGAFADKAGADELSASLQRAGYPVYLSDSQQGARWRVRVGPHPSRAEAEVTAKRLEASQKLPTWVLRDDS